MCDCTEVKRLTVLLNMERLKTKIYRQIIEQKIDIKLDDRVDDIINEVVVKKCSPAKRSVEDIRNKPESRYDIKLEPKRKYKLFPKTIEESDVTYGENNTLVDSNIKEEVTEKFGLVDISVSNLEIKRSFEALRESRTYVNILTDIKKYRNWLMSVLTPLEYSKLVVEHIAKCENIFTERGYQKKKISSTILPKFLTPLDYKLSFTEGYEKQHVELDDIQKFKLCLKLSANYPKVFRCFDYSHFYTFFINYSLSFFCIYDMIKMYVSNPYGFFNVVYVPVECQEDQHGFSFYILDKVEQGKRLWKMDCRLEHITDELRGAIKNYILVTFRKNYKNCIGHNNYIENYTQKSEVLEFDCDQLIKNLIICSDDIKFNENIRETVKNECTYQPTTIDKFDFLQDDKEQYNNFKQHKVTDEDIISTIKDLFDNIEDEQARNIFICQKT
jgi:hypothetical protein